VQDRARPSTSVEESVEGLTRAKPTGENLLSREESRWRRVMRIRIAIGAIAASLMAGCGRGPGVGPGETAEREVDPSGITVVPALDAPIVPGRSTAWCASFQAAWNRLAKDIVKGPPVVKGAEELCRRLNGAAPVEADLPEGTFYAAAGWTRDGILERIRKEMAAAFPSAPAPDLGGGDVAAVTYAYLEASVKFEIPFFESREPLVFKDSMDRETKVTSFGIREEHEYAYQKLRHQVGVLFVLGLTEFAIDPCKTSDPVQVILARVQPKATLAETVSDVERKIIGSRGFKSRDVLLIPNVAFRSLRRFKELEGNFTNAGMDGAGISDALQSIRFRLTREGAELQSEAKIHVSPGAQHFIFDGPFLVYMKKRAGGRPFFALWVDGPELLEKWRG
jgi:hypothetical protein